MDFHWSTALQARASFRCIHPPPEPQSLPLQFFCNRSPEHNANHFFFFKVQSSLVSEFCHLSCLDSISADDAASSPRSSKVSWSSVLRGKVVLNLFVANLQNWQIQIFLQMHNAWSIKNLDSNRRFTNIGALTIVHLLGDLFCFLNSLKLTKLGTLLARICSQKTFLNWKEVQSVVLSCVQFPQLPTIHLVKPHGGNFPVESYLGLQGSSLQGSSSFGRWYGSQRPSSTRSKVSLKMLIGVNCKMLKPTFAEQKISLCLVPPPQGALHSPEGPSTQA